MKLRLNTTLGRQVFTPRQIKRNNKHYAERAPLRNTAISSPRLTKDSRKLKSQPDMSMILKVSMPKSGRQLQTNQNSVTRLDDISNKDMDIRVYHTREHLLNIQRSTFPGFDRTTATTSTKNRGTSPPTVPSWQKPKYDKQPAVDSKDADQEEWHPHQPWES